MLILPLLSFVLSSNDWYHDLSPDIATVVLKTSPNNENWQEKSTIRLDSIKYQSNAVRLESRHVVIVGNGITRTDVFEGRMNKGTLFSISNSTCSFSSLSFHPHTSNVLHAAGYSFCEVSQSKIVLSDPVSPFECTDSTLCIDSTDFVVNTPSNTVQSLVTTTRFSSSMKLSSCSLQDILVASDSSLTASSLIQRTIIDSCHLQNISHVAKRTQSPPVTLPFNVTVCCSSFVDCVNTLSGGVVRNVEDQTTLRAINNTFTRTISNGHDEGKTFENLTEADIVEEDHSYLFCVFRNCTGTQTAGGAIRCRAGFSVSVTSCEFYDNEAVSDKFDYEHILADGGAIHFNGQSTGGLTIVQSLFERNTANVGGSIGSQNANHLNIQYSNITDGYTIYYNDGKYSYGAGIALNVVPMESIMKNIRFLNCTSEQTGGSIDCNYMSGSITFSNLFIAHSTCTTGNVIFSNVKDKSAIIQFFSCTFFENIATDNSQSYPSPSDVRYYNAEPWLSLLLLKSTFVNCFSNSPTPKIGILNDTTYTTTFNYGESPNSTELDVHLPDPAVIVNEQEGEDKPGCGAKYDNKCNTIAYAGKNRMAEKAGIVLIEAGRFQETDSFDLDTKSGSFTSFGDLTPIISFALSDGAPAFVTKGTGTVRFEYLHFVPSADTSVILQNGNGVLEVVNCVFLNTDELNPLISTAILKAVEGAVSLSTVEFSSLSFDGGCCVECVGTSSKLDISNCKFLQTKGVSLAQIVFEPSTPDSAVFSMKSTTLQGQEGTGVGGLKLTNVASVTVESVTMRRLESKTQKAAISIAKCSSLTLSSLLFELNSGTDASDLFVDSESLPVVSSTSSFSVSPSPTTSINGEQSDTVIPRQVLLVDASSAAQGPFCWATDGCKSISSLLPRLPAGVDWSLSMKEGIVGDLTLSMPEKQSIAVTGTSQAGSILQHTSLISSAFVEVSTGSLSLSQLTLATASTDPTLSSSFFIVSGGSLSLESVLVPSLSFSNSAAFAELTGSGSLSLKSVSFSDMSNEGSGSVVHSTSTGTISLDTVSFTRCNCGVNGKGRSVLIEPSSPFTATSVVMKDVTIEEEGTSGSHEVFLNGSSIPVTITSSNFGSTLGALADQTQTTMAQFVGEETSDSTMSGPLAYLLHRHETGTVYVDSSFWNHKFCGLATLPCQTLEATHEKLNENNQIVDFSSDLSMTGTVTSKATSSTIQSTATKTLTLTGSAQFVVSVGVLTLNALKLTVEDITTSRTSALVSVTTGSLAVSACSITIIDQTNTVPLVSVEGGSVIFSGATSVVNPPLTSSLLDVSGGSLSVTSPLSVTPINAARTTPLFDLEGGTTTLSSSVKSLFTSGTVFSVKPTAVLNLNTITDDLASTILGNLVTMTGGSVVLSGSFANGKLSESLVSGSGNLLIDDSSFTTFSPLSASNAESRLLTVTISTGETVQIGTSAKQVVFTSCSSSASGGVIHATVKGTGLLLIQNTKFDSCSTAQNGQAVYCVVESGNEKSALGNIRASLLPPTPSTIPAFSDSERTLAEYAVTSNGDETHVGSILYPFHPSTAQLSVHATAGHDHPLCGNTDLPCQSLKQAYSNIPAKTATHSLLIDTSVVLNEKLSTEDKTATISAEAGKKLEIDASGQFHLAIGKLIFANSELVLPSSCSRTVFDVCGASLEFLSTSLISHVGQSASKTTLQAPLFSLSSGSLIIQGEDGNPFKFSHFQTSPVISVDGTESPTLTLIHCHFVDCKSDGNAVIVLNGEKSGKVSFAHCYFNENSGLSSNDVWTSLAWNSALNQSSITSCFSDSNMDHLVVGTVLKNGFIPFSVLKVDPTSGDNLSCELPTIPCSTVLRSLELCVQTETDLSPALRLIEMTADVTESTSFVVGDKKIELNGTTADVQLRWDSSRHTMLSVSKGSADLHHFVLVHLHPSSTASFLTLLDVGALTLTSVVLDGSQDTFKTCLIQTEAGTLTLISVDISNVTLESSSLLVSKGAVFMEDCSFTSIISRHLSSPIKIGKTGIN